MSVSDRIRLIFFTCIPQKAEAQLRSLQNAQTPCVADFEDFLVLAWQFNPNADGAIFDPIFDINANGIIKLMDEARVRDLRADEQRVRYLVRTGAGQSGITTMRNSVGRHSKNVGLRLAGARVCLQAEDYSRAATYFQQAKRNGANVRLAETGLALAQVYGRRKLGAENSLERALAG